MNRGQRGRNPRPENENPGQAVRPARGEFVQWCRTRVCRTPPGRADEGSKEQVKLAPPDVSRLQGHCTPGAGSDADRHQMQQGQVAGSDPRLHANLIANWFRVRGFARFFTKKRLRDASVALLRSGYPSSAPSIKRLPGDSPLNLEVQSSGFTQTCRKRTRLPGSWPCKAKVPWPSLRSAKRPARSASSDSV